MPEIYEVFLCYPAYAEAECQSIADAVQEWGYSVFFDKRSVQTGESFSGAADKAIKSVKFGVICLGIEDLGKRQIKECEGLNWESEERELRLIPFLLSGASLRTIPYYLVTIPAAKTLLELRGKLSGEKGPIDLPTPIDKKEKGVGTTSVEGLFFRLDARKL